MPEHWLLTWTTYGTWLPGDRRGFVGKQVAADGTTFCHNLPGTPYDSDNPPLKQAMADRMLGPAIYLCTEQAQVLLKQLRATAEFRKGTLLAAAVMSWHLHLVVGTSGEVASEKLLQDFKAYGSRALNQRWSKPPNGTWWTESGSRRKLPHKNAVKFAVRYVSLQPGVLATWLPVDWREL